MTIFCPCLNLKFSASVSPDSSSPSDGVGCTEHFMGQRGRNQDSLVPYGELSTQHVILLQPPLKSSPSSHWRCPVLLCRQRWSALSQSILSGQTPRFCIPRISRQNPNSFLNYLQASTSQLPPPMPQPDDTAQTPRMQVSQDMALQQSRDEHQLSHACRRLDIIILPWVHAFLRMQ